MSGQGKERGLEDPGRPLGPYFCLAGREKAESPRDIIPPSVPTMASCSVRGRGQTRTHPVLFLDQAFVPQEALDYHITCPELRLHLRRCVLHCVARQVQEWSDQVNRSHAEMGARHNYESETEVWKQGLRSDPYATGPMHLPSSSLPFGLWVHFRHAFVSPEMSQHTHNPPSA